MNRRHLVFALVATLVAAFFAAAASLAAWPLASYFLEHPEHFSRRMSQASSLGDSEPLRALAHNFSWTLSQLFREGSTIPRHNLTGNPQVFWPISVLLGLGLILHGHAAIRARLRGTAETRWLRPALRCCCWPGY